VNYATVVNPSCGPQLGTSNCEAFRINVDQINYGIETVLSGRIIDSLMLMGGLSVLKAPLEEAFTCQTGIQVNDTAMGSADAGRQITAGGQVCDLYAPASYLDIDLFMKPAAYANFPIVFAHGKRVLAYSARGSPRRSCLR
jgi:hypothetical protein